MISYYNHIRFDARECTQHCCIDSRARRADACTHLALGELLPPHVVHHLLDALVRAELEERRAPHCLRGLGPLLRSERRTFVANDMSLPKRRSRRGLFVDLLALRIDNRGGVNVLFYLLLGAELEWRHQLRRAKLWLGGWVSGKWGSQLNSEGSRPRGRSAVPVASRNFVPRV